MSHRFEAPNQCLSVPRWLSCLKPIDPDRRRDRRSCGGDLSPPQDQPWHGATPCEGHQGARRRDGSPGDFVRWQVRPPGRADPDAGWETAERGSDMRRVGSSSSPTDPSSPSGGACAPPEDSLGGASPELGGDLLGAGVREPAPGLGSQGRADPNRGLPGLPIFVPHGSAGQPAQNRSSPRAIHAPATSMRIAVYPTMSLALTPVMASRGSAQKGWSMLVSWSP